MIIILGIKNRTFRIILINIRIPIRNTSIRISAATAAIVSSDVNVGSMFIDYDKGGQYERTNVEVSLAPP